MSVRNVVNEVRMVFACGRGMATGGAEAESGGLELEDMASGESIKQDHAFPLDEYFSNGRAI